jgi:hypothetical protein
MVEVLAIRMKQVLGSLISSNLNAFIGGCGGTNSRFSSYSQQMSRHTKI